MAPEIQNIIFELCLVHPDHIGDKLKLQKRVEGFTVAHHYPKGEPRPKLSEAYEASMTNRTKKIIRDHSLRNLPVMQTCQAVYNVAAPVFWGQRFTFDTLMQLQTFLFSCDVRHDLVRNIRVWKLSQNIGINFMPAICLMLQEKLTGLEHLEVDLGNLREYKQLIEVSNVQGFKDDEHLRMAGKNLGFGIYSCMHPWVTKVLREQGMDKLMSILRIIRESDPIDLGHGDPRVHRDFQGRGKLTRRQRVIADTATAWEIIRLVDLYENKARVPLEA